MTARTAMRIAAAVWLVGGVIGVVIDLWQQSLWAEIDAGAELDTVLERIQTSSWVSQVTHLVSTATLVGAASSWARDRPLVRIGQGLLALALLVGLWLVIVRVGQSTFTELESLEHVGTINAVVFFVALALLLAPTRAPLAARVGFAVLAAGWVFYLHVVFDPTGEANEQLVPLFTAMPLVLSATWSAGAWLGSTHEIDAPVEADAIGVDDPARLQAAAGIALLRTCMLVRIVLAIGSVAMLVAVRADPGSSSAVVWLAALGHCALAFVIATALTRYGALPDQALERGHVTTVIVCLAIAALLELYGASQAATLYDVLGRANDGDFSNMPRLDDLEAMQTRAQWVGRIATAIGLVAAVALATSLRKTALWLEELPSSDRASTLVVMTILGGGCATILVAVAQSGAIRELEVMVAAMLGALAAAIAILVLWLRLLGGIAAALRRPKTAVSAAPSSS